MLIKDGYLSSRKENVQKWGEGIFKSFKCRVALIGEMPGGACAGDYEDMGQWLAEHVHRTTVVPGVVIMSAGIRSWSCKRPVIP